MLKRKQIQWARLLGKWEEGSLVRKSWTMVSNARHLTCDNKEAWQSNEDKPPGQDQNYWPLIKAIECKNIVTRQTKAPDTAICAQGLWNQQKGMSTILTRFRRDHLAENILRSCALTIRLHEETFWIQVVIMCDLLPWRAALKPFRTGRQNV